jgi:hypothetical protein
MHFLLQPLLPDAFLVTTIEGKVIKHCIAGVHIFGEHKPSLFGASFHLKSMSNFILVLSWKLFQTSSLLWAVQVHMVII